MLDVEQIRKLFKLTPIVRSYMDLLDLKRPIVFLDLETTGINIRTDRIVEISVIKYNPDGTEIEKTKRVNPRIPIPAGASEVHGIRD